MKQRVSMGSGGQAIVVTNLEFDNEGFGTSQKAGILPIDAEADQAEMLEKAAGYEWELHGQKNIQGFYSVKKKRALNEEELSRQVVSATGRSITNEVFEEEASTGDAKRDIRQETNTPSRANQPALVQR